MVSTSPDVHALAISASSKRSSCDMVSQSCVEMIKCSSLELSYSIVTWIQVSRRNTLIMRKAKNARLSCVILAQLRAEHVGCVMEAEALHQDTGDDDDLIATD